MAPIKQMLGFELSEDQFYVLLAFGYRPARMPEDELDAAIEDVLAFARAELERSAVHGYRQSDLPYPEDVLAAFHQKFLPAPDELLKALAERPLSSLSPDQARERLYEEISRARRELARAGAMARGAGGGEVPLHPPLPLQRSPVRAWRRVALEPARGAARDRPGYWLWKPPPGWENEGPWGGSLAWLEEQRRPEVEEPCDRCNWPGRYPELVGLDDGGDPRRILARAKGGSTGARRLLQQGNRPREDLLEGLDWIDHMRATGDRRCALCGGLGYAVPLKRDRYVRLRRSRAKGAGPDDQIVGRLLEGFDERGRLRPQWDRSPETSAGWEAEPAVGEDTEFGWGAEALHLLRDEQALVRRIVAATVIYQARGRTLVEGERVDAHKRDYDETPAVLEPLALRQFLADASFTGSGRTGDERRWAFRKRNAVLFELITLGFPLERVADAVGLSSSRLSNLAVVKVARKAFKDSQRGMALYWHERGHSTKEIARALGLPLRTIQRMVKEAAKPASDVPLGETSTIKLIGMALTHAQVLAEIELWPGRRTPQPPRPLTIEELREAKGIPIDYYERVPPGMPLQVEAASYHSYVPGEQERFGAPGDGDPRSRHDVLHTFLHALLARTQPKRVHR